MTVYHYIGRINHQSIFDVWNHILVLDVAIPKYSHLFFINQIIVIEPEIDLLNFVYSRRLNLCSRLKALV